MNGTMTAVQEEPRKMVAVPAHEEPRESDVPASLEELVEHLPPLNALCGEQFLDMPGVEVLGEAVQRELLLIESRLNPIDDCVNSTEFEALVSDHLAALQNAARSELADVRRRLEDLRLNLMIWLQAVNHGCVVELNAAACEALERLRKSLPGTDAGRIASVAVCELDATEQRHGVTDSLCGYSAEQRNTVLRRRANDNGDAEELDDDDAADVESDAKDGAVRCPEAIAGIVALTITLSSISGNDQCLVLDVTIDKDDFPAIHDDLRTVVEKHARRFADSLAAGTVGEVAAGGAYYKKLKGRDE